MGIQNFTNPLTIVQTISIYTYLNTLSDFLQTENFLAENDKHRLIPTVNGLCHFLEENSGNRAKTLVLARELLRDSNLYGEDDNETPDDHFVDTLFDYIMSYPVFTNHVNMFGFLADIVRSLNVATSEVLSSFTIAHLDSKFENEYGADSSLSSCSRKRIFKNLFTPLFPISDKDASLISVNWIYAQAGLMFLKSNHSNFAYHPDNSNVDEFLAVGLIIEQLVIAGQIDKSALRIFALPALIHYVHQERENLRDEKIEDIITDPDHWAKAYHILFSYLSGTFEDLKRLQDSDLQYQFLSALYNFNDRPTLARQLIEKHCSSVGRKTLKDAVTEFENDPLEYECEGTNGTILLTSIENIFRDQKSNIAKEYYLLERKLLQEAFSDSFIEWIYASRAIVRRKKVDSRHYRLQTRISETIIQLKPSDYFLQLYYPDTNQHILYALVRENGTLTGVKYKILRIDSMPTTYSQFVDHLFPENDSQPLKNTYENLEVVWEKLANERTKELRVYLSSIETNQQISKFRKDFGEHLFPSVERDDYKATIMRTSIRTALNIGNNESMLEAVNFTELVRNYMFNVFEIDINRLVDPGLELASDVGKGGMKSIGRMVDKISKRFIFSANATKEKIREVLATSPRKVDEKFGKAVYVNSLSSDNNSGYGYKFIYLPDGNVAELKNVHEFESEVPVVLHRVTEGDEKLYRMVAPETGQMLENDLHVKSSRNLQETPEFKYYDGYLESIENTAVCQPQRHKRTPQAGPSGCIKVSALDKKIRAENEAIEYASSLKKSELAESGKQLEADGIREELRKYVFPDNDKTELDFVKDWLADENMKVPEWSVHYRMSEPEMFFNLRYRDNIDDVVSLTVENVKEKISSLYSKKKIRKLQRYYSVDDLLDIFRNEKAFMYANFEDFYAIVRYQWTSFSKMVEDNDEARRMKIALYRLAIRQSDDRTAEYSKILYRGERRHPKDLLDLQVGKGCVLNRFTLTSKSIGSAAEHVSKHSLGPKVRVIYKIKFDQTYLRADLESFGSSSLANTILLPGTEFHIDKVIEKAHEVENLSIGPYVKIEMTYEPVQKFRWQQQIMAEIEKLKNSGTKFYQEDSVQCRRGGCFSKIKAIFSGEKEHASNLLDNL